MRFGLMLVAAACFLLVLGGQGMYEAAASGRQKTISYEDFVRQRPGVGWYKITGVNWTLVDGIYSKKENTGEIESRIFLPIHDARLDPDARDREPVVVMLQTERSDIHATAEALSHTNNNDDAMLAVLKANPTTAFYNGSIEGTVQFGTDASSDTRDKLSNLPGSNLDPRYVILKDGARPNGLAAFGEFLGGIAVGAFAFFYFKTRYSR